MKIDILLYSLSTTTLHFFLQNAIPYARISFRPSSKTPFDGFLENFQFLLAVLTFGAFANTLLSVTSFLQVQKFYYHSFVCWFHLII